MASTIQKERLITISDPRPSINARRGNQETIIRTWSAVTDLPI
jgi:hypothetical protein